MTDLNLEWLEQNFKNKSAIIYNVGCAQLSDDSLRMQTCLPDSTIFSFECSDHWKLINETESKYYNLHYLHCAVSNNVGEKLFSYKKTNTEFHAYSGTLSLDSDDGDYSKRVACITIDEFCKSHQRPNILHIDAEYDEYNILCGISDCNLPEIVWLENNDFYNDANSKLTVSYYDLCDFLKLRGYDLIISARHDSLFVKRGHKTTPYVHVPLNRDVWSTYEKKLQEKIWLKKYNLIKSSSWPDIASVFEFENLDQQIKQECINNYNFNVDRRFFE